MWQFIIARFVHFLFILVLVAGGVLLSISISRDDSSVALVMVESFTAIAWAIYSRITRERA
ncbi:hypothetical protein BGZ57DRAFT_915270 [Hyaloscypha finlandica]|nr:hypothetical protein BGZ57DRAFT_915270 [Hyaloscypha finlandica]